MGIWLARVDYDSYLRVVRAREKWTVGCGIRGDKTRKSEILAAGVDPKNLKKKMQWCLKNFKIPLPGDHGRMSLKHNTKPGPNRVIQRGIGRKKKEKKICPWGGEQHKKVKNTENYGP